MLSLLVNSADHSLGGKICWLWPAGRTLLLLTALYRTDAQVHLSRVHQAYPPLEALQTVACRLRGPGDPSMELHDGSPGCWLDRPWPPAHLPAVGPPSSAGGLSLRSPRALAAISHCAGSCHCHAAAATGAVISWVCTATWAGNNFCDVNGGQWEFSGW